MLESYTNIKGNKVIIKKLTDKELVLSYKFFQNLVRKICGNTNPKDSIVSANSPEIDQAGNLIKVRDSLKEEIKNRKIKMSLFQNNHLPDKE